MRPTPPFPDTEMGKADECENTDQTKGAPERHGTLRNLAERRNLDIPHWDPPYFDGFPPNYVIYVAPATPFSQRPDGKGGRARNYRPKKGARRNYSIWIPPIWNHPYSGRFLPDSLIFSAHRSHFPNTQMGKEVRCETTDQNKASQRNTAIRHGTPRNPTEPDGTPKFGYSALESAIFWWIHSEFSNIFLRPTPLFPTPKWGKGRNAKLPTKKATPRGY